MEKNNDKCGIYREALSYLGDTERDMIESYISSSGTSESSINEIRLRADGPVTLSVSGKNVSVAKGIGESAMRDIFKRVAGGAVFAHREDLCRGFITVGRGIRVGVCGHARYESGKIVGVGDISALVFRLPSAECSFAPRLYRLWRADMGGMLICSAAGEGKTTAIRSLARLIGSGAGARRVVVVDERMEFDPTAYRDAQVDVLRGYRRSLGVDIAIRTMSAEILIVDEISTAEDADAMLSALGAGVTVIATTHARSLADAMRRDYVKRLVMGGLFDSVCIVKRVGESYDFTHSKIEL